MKSFPKFFTKQFVGFIALALLIIVIDFFLYIGFTVYQVRENVTDSWPSAITTSASRGLTSQDGAYVLSDDAAKMLDEQQAWAILIGTDGDVVWNRNAPADVLKHYTLTDTALFAHYGDIDKEPVFIWARDDGLFVVGFPVGSYTVVSTMAIPQGMVNSALLFTTLVLFADLLIFFLVYMLSKRRTIKNVKPISDALDKLSQGQTVEIYLKGDMAEVGERINETSAIIAKKDRARDNWIRGISHDIRTPLSMITGRADGIASDEGLPAGTREDAASIRAQGMKIRDLVLDLNTASQLDYDMQPLQMQQIPVARLLREMVAEQLNSALPPQYSFQLAIADDAGGLVVLGDERLLKRALQNLMQNAMSHNPDGCTITVSLAARQGGGAPGAWGVNSGIVRVSDNGRGMGVGALAKLHQRLYDARIADQDGIVPDTGTDDELSREHGLGLVLVEKIVRAHGGVMQVSSVEGQGFAADISLPMQDVSQTPKADEPYYKE